jgi:hypothetical protein
MSTAAVVSLPRIEYSHYPLNGYTVLVGPNLDDPTLMDAAVLFTTIRLLGYSAIECHARIETMVRQLRPAVDVLDVWQL